MKVDSMSLAMASQHQYQQSLSVKQDISVWQTPPASSAAGDDVSLSEAGKAASQQDEDWGEQGLTPALAMLRSLLEKTFGIHIRLQDVRELSAQASGGTTANLAASDTSISNPEPQLGMRVQREFHYQEQESLQFSASGNITTRDGRLLSFQLDISLQRSFELHSSETLNFGAAAKDPLMLTLGNDAGALSGATVAFDLDGNGSQDAMPLLRNGGWLVLDRNGDGRVNDRSELFGPQSGNGFAELATLDGDGNHAIDEGDPLFAQLKLWQGRDGAQDQLTPLLELGIGAILLPSIDAEFAHTDAQGATLAQMRRAGVYLNENGSAGLVGQLDVSV